MITELKLEKVTVPFFSVRTLLLINLKTQLVIYLVHQATKITKACIAGFVLPSGAYLQHLHHSDGSSSQGRFNISDLFRRRNG